MNFLNRPVFQFEIDWADQVNKAFSFDLAELLIGFGAEVFAPLQQAVAQGFQVTLDLRTPVEIKAFEDFTGALKGMLSGFWFPAPWEGMLLAGGVSSTQFDIIDQGLTNTWQDHPDVYLYFEANGVTSQAAKITAVSAIGGGKERVTIQTALADWATLFASTALVRRLHYVRLAEDVERGSYQAEGWLRRECRVIELPTEYANQETGQTPIILYHSWCEPPMDTHWYYTSFAADVIYLNKIYKAFSISHGPIKQGVKAQAETLDIDAAYDANHPFALFVPLPFPRRLNVQVMEITLTELTGSTTYSATFANNSGVAIGFAAATPFPSAVNVSGVTGTITAVKVKLIGLSHLYPVDLDIYVKSPTGTKVQLMSDAGGTSPVSGIDLTFDASAGSDIPSGSLTGGTWRPKNYSPDPDTGYPFAAGLASFVGEAPNGNWNLYIVGDNVAHFGDVNSLAGWSVEIASSGGPLPARTLFVGRVRRVPDKGDRLTATCDSFLALLSKKVPKMLIKKDCDYEVYEPRTCKALRALFATSGVIAEVDNSARPPTIAVTLDFPTDDRETEDWFAGGWIETGQGLNFEVRTVLNSYYDWDGGLLTLTLNAPMMHAVAGQSIQLLPGCDGTAEICDTKFNNFPNHGGFVAIPQKNLSLTAVENTATQGDKK